MGFSEKGDELLEKIKANKVTHDHYYNGEQQSMSKELNLEQVAQTLELVTQKVEKVDKILESWDTNENNILEKPEITAGILKSLPSIARLISAIAAVAAIIEGIRGYVSKEFNWATIIFAISILLTFATVYIVLKNSSQSTIKTVDRVSNEHWEQIRKINEDNIKHYGDLKSRFIEYKSNAEDQERSLRKDIRQLTDEISAWKTKATIYAYNAVSMNKIVATLDPERKIPIPDISKIQEDLDK